MLVLAFGMDGAVVVVVGVVVAPAGAADADNVANAETRIDRVKAGSIFIGVSLLTSGIRHATR